MCVGLCFEAVDSKIGAKVVIVGTGVVEADGHVDGGVRLEI